MSTKTVTIHGTRWRWDQIQEDVDQARRLDWEAARFVARDAVVVKRRDDGSYVTAPAGSADDEVGEVLAGHWDHEHCEICWWKMHASTDPSRSRGYRHDNRWLCVECFEQFVAPAL